LRRSRRGGGEKRENPLKPKKKERGDHTKQKVTLEAGRTKTNQTGTERKGGKYVTVEEWKEVEEKGGRTTGGSEGHRLGKGASNSRYGYRRGRREKRGYRYH